MIRNFIRKSSYTATQNKERKFWRFSILKREDAKTIGLRKVFLALVLLSELFLLLVNIKAGIISWQVLSGAVINSAQIDPWVRLTAVLPTVYKLQFIIAITAVLILPNRLKRPFNLLSGITMLQLAIQFLVASAHPFSFYLISSALSLVLILLIAANYSPKLSNC